MWPGSCRIFSDLMPHLPCRPCVMPSVENALKLSSEVCRYRIQIDGLRDGLGDVVYSIPLATNLAFCIMIILTYIPGCPWVSRQRLSRWFFSSATVELLFRVFVM